MTIDNLMALGILAAVLALAAGYGLRVVVRFCSEKLKRRRRDADKEWTAKLWTAKLWTAKLRRGAQSKSQATSGRTAQHGKRKSVIISKLRNFIERHPYLPLIAMAVLDMAGYLFEDLDNLLSMPIEKIVGKVLCQLDNAFTSINGFMELFPEEIFVAITAYSLSRKMRSLKEKESEVEEVVDKLKRTGQILEGIWMRGGGDGKNRGVDDDRADTTT